MSSNPSSSIASSNWFSRLDPSRILMPIFLGFLRAAPFVPFIAMFFRPSFGLSGGLPAPNAWALAAMGAIAFWSTRLLPRYVKNPALVNVLLLLIGFLWWGIWMWLEPLWHIGDVLKDPLSIVDGNGRFAWILVVTLVFWVLSLRLALDEREQSPEGVRGIMFRSLIGVLVAIIFAAIVGDEFGDAGLSAGYIALPVALVSGIGAVGLSEMVSTRNTARRRGATVPGWSRWGRTFLGSTAMVLVLTFVAALMFGPGFLQLVLDAIRTLWEWFSTIMLGIMYVVVYAIYYIVRFIVWLLNLLFGTEFEPMEVPEMGQAPGGEEPLPPEEGEAEPSPYAALLRLGAIGAAIMVALLVISKFIRFRQTDETIDPNEERSSVFSGSLFRDQLRNLFRRKDHGEKPRKLNLNDSPATVRESMLYLQVLAERLGMGREIRETPHDFTSRLGTTWPQLEAPLREIRDRYERVRYGESEEDRAAVVSAWREIWNTQKELPGASG